MSAILVVLSLFPSTESIQRLRKLFNLFPNSICSCLKRMKSSLDITDGKKGRGVRAGFCTFSVERLSS